MKFVKNMILVTTKEIINDCIVFHKTILKPKKKEKEIYVVAVGKKRKYERFKLYIKTEFI